MELLEEEGGLKKNKYKFKRDKLVAKEGKFSLQNFVANSTQLKNDAITTKMEEIYQKNFLHKLSTAVS